MAMNLPALGSGLAGALAVTAVHESARIRLPAAPRMDVLGMRAIRRSIVGLGGTPPRGQRLRSAALLGDLVSNSMYYSLVGQGRPQTVWLRGLALGLAAGIGAVVLPGPLKLGDAPSNRTRSTQVMTIAWYTIGGLAAAATYNLLRRMQPR